MPVFHSLTISNIRKETDDTVSIAFDVPEALQEEYRYNAGQYLTLKTVIDGEDTRRSYSICSGLFCDELRVAVKKIKGGLFSSFANNGLKVGDKLDVMTPMGNFYTPLDKDHKKHYVGFAAGSGITPLIAMIRTVLAYEPLSTFTLVYGNKTRKSIIFREDLVDLKNSYMGRFNMINILSREDQEVQLFSGRITGEKADEIMDKLIPAGGADEVYLCGPEEMITGVSQRLEARGMAKKNIHFELFTSPSVTQGEKQAVEQEASADLKGKMSQVTVIVDGDEFNFDLDMGGENILDAAMEHGADVPFACKGGVCCTCRAKLIEGKVNMEINYSLEQEEVDAGFILTCQSHPLTEKIVVDFDHR
ncbi:1,2-phenylacetyl-CoA epoxidase subunit PaaE [Paremcibacter congregatus]|uniref:Phenylacetic acid degradation protein n=1 Tax=Paremcibacter congregatus TaxID=2043170 RepID=A0A2G4YWN0_9PROT|nr:1,2-phenylacetyl-CoA epoxidase subunit PaaE [Paremcibacter congregatus]PHZ86660.1 phenylacetic acid degradation protein [Paremcibacter congregatus]QDE26461.1 phenylacetate-CoA oxygenase/reductase subunit PaaK [Paremcibacter congregatus]